MKSTLILAVLAGVCIAVQNSLTGVFGAGADFNVLKALGVLLIIAGSILVVGY